MKKRTSYYVTRSNVLTWVAALLALAAAVGFVVYAALSRAGTTAVWIFCVLPVAASLHFILTVLVHGKERLYLLAISFWLLTAAIIYLILAAKPVWYFAILMIIVQLACAVGMTAVISGKTKHDWLMIVFAGIPIAALAWLVGKMLASSASLAELLRLLPTAVLLLGYILIGLAMHAFPDDGTYRKTWGDRPDGRRVRSLDPITVVGSYIMSTRTGAANMFKDKLEITTLEKYLREKKNAGLDGFGMTVPLLAAYVRTVAKYPAMNRFLSGQKIYSRDEDIQFCMVVKKDMTTEASETIIKLHLSPYDTAMDVYEKFNSAVLDVRKTKELDSSFDGAAKLIGMIPGVLLKFAIWLLKLLDYFGLIPKALLEVSPFHGSVFFTSMGSLGIPAIHHHLYDFGNLPVFCAFGRKFRARELDEDGNTVDRKYIDYSFTIDERTTDGFYFATALKYFQKLLRRPEQLDEKPEEVKHDVP